MPDEHLGGAFVWDKAKSDRIFKERGFDFAFASGIFETDYVESYDDQHSNDEDRYVCIGYVGGVCLTLIYTERDNVKRIITAW